MKQHNTNAAKPKRKEAVKLKVERLQTRVSKDSGYVDELSERIKAGDLLPPITVVTDGDSAWLADGIHRLDAAIAAKKTILVDYIAGDRGKAVEIACGANQSHGLRRTNADKRHAVTMALQELGKRSDRAIAKICGVGNKFVGDVRAQVCSEHTSDGLSLVEDSPTSDSARKEKDVNKHRAKTVKKTVKRHTSATDFNPAALEKEAAATPKSKKPKSGKSIVGPNQRKACQTHFGGLIRALQAVGIYDEFIDSLNQIAERLKQI